MGQQESGCDCRSRRPAARGVAQRSHAELRRSGKSEEEIILPLTILEMQGRIQGLRETLSVETDQVNEKSGKKLQTTDLMEEKGVEERALYRMPVPELQSLAQKLEQEYESLKDLEGKLHKEIVGLSSFRNKAKPPHVVQPQLVANSAEEIARQAPTLLLGLECSPAGMSWDTRAQEVPLGPRDERHRRQVREGTKAKVVKELGLEFFGAEAHTASALPPQHAETVLYLDRTRPQEPGSNAGGAMLLGRYDVVFVRVCADFDRSWSFLRGARHDFWVAHAAAVNVGESTEAEDFSCFAKEVNNGAASGRLDDTQYLGSMSKIMGNFVGACRDMKVEHLVLFPFGMGAFLRHLGQLDSRFTWDEEQQRLRRALARAFVEALQKSQPRLQVHICISFCSEEAQRNADAFLRALIDAPPAFRKRVNLVVEGDSFEVAHELAMTSPNVVLLNGANRRLLGNHWFAGRARTAIDENLHRRSWRLAALSYLLNGFDGQEPLDREEDALQRVVERLGGQVRHVKEGPDNVFQAMIDNISAALPALRR